MVAGPLTVSDQSFGAMNVFPLTVVSGVSATRLFAAGEAIAGADDCCGCPKLRQEESRRTNALAHAFFMARPYYSPPANSATPVGARLGTLTSRPPLPIERMTVFFCGQCLGRYS